MQWLSNNMALVIAVSLQLISLSFYVAGNNRGDLTIYIGFGVIGILFFLLWLGQRGKH